MRPASPAREVRRAQGEAARRAAPPSQYATWVPAADRNDPVALLLSQATTRIAELVPLRHARMAASPFAYFRGAALPMAADLAPVAVSGLRVQACGDAHLGNFGMFASPERELVFDMNDFDETVHGAWEWDVMRLAASLVVAARTRGFHPHHARQAVLDTVRTYGTRMAEYAGMRAIDVYYARVGASATLEEVGSRAQAYLQTTIHSAAHRDALHELPKLTARVDGHLRIVDDPPTITHPRSLDPDEIPAAIESYRSTLGQDRRDLLDRYAFVDAALKVVGVGSVGLGAFVALMLGADDDDPLFLQVKEAEASVYERFGRRSKFDHHGERVVAGQRRLQAASDVLLGWTMGSRGRHLYVRQLQDQKAGPIVEAMTHTDLAAWGGLCGWALARGHARSGDPVAIAGYLGGDDAMAAAMAAFAERYADQNQRDYDAFVAAIKHGRVVADDRLEGVVPTLTTRTGSA